MFQFKFIKYTQPGWQFNIKPQTDLPVATAFYHPIYQKHKPKEIEQDLSFETETARFADVGFRSWQSGFLALSCEKDSFLISSMPSPNLKDEYRFVAKYWGVFFVCYAFIVRLVSLKNPFAEVPAFVKALRIKKVNIHQNLTSTTEYNNYLSPLVNAQPSISVIIPTLNRYEYLKDALHDLEKQTYKNFEVIIIDQSEDFKKEFYDQFDLNIVLEHQREKLLWTARNNAVKLSKADYLLFFDDDSRVEGDWIEQHLKSLDYFKVDISAGVSFATVGAKSSASYKYFRWADQFDSGNALVKRSVFQKIGLFDLQYNKMRQGDGEFGYRAFKNGVSSISNPFAYRIHLKVKDGGLREIGSWDGFRQKKWFQPKPVPSVVFQYKKYLGGTLSRHAIILGMLLSNVHLKHKKNKGMLFLSAILFVVKSPVLLFQYYRSRKIAMEMLRRDNGIEMLN
ncbi:MAG TPA: glycosyltransferase family A protein [Segetibacter sp.]